MLAQPASRRRHVRGRQSLRCQMRISPPRAIFDRVREPLLLFESHQAVRSRLIASRARPAFRCQNILYKLILARRPMRTLAQCSAPWWRTPAGHKNRGVRRGHETAAMLSDGGVRFIDLYLQFAHQPFAFFAFSPTTRRIPRLCAWRDRGRSSCSRRSRIAQIAQALLFPPEPRC